ncbi:tyrosine-type recombinase/integrase [Bradyrhizobium diazoefficiens]|nr:site-specific integrase [Bradyrhizobium diazoefficiens]MBR0847186.1 tyrosine-type recombinase/integrase [Bradyrhizobium diazoefficiens]
MPKVLTVAAVKSLRPGAERREVPDGGATFLRLVIQPSGSKSFAMRFRRPDGRPAKLVLGPVDYSEDDGREPVIGMPLTLTAARKLAATLARDRALGRDIVADRKADKNRQNVERANHYAGAVRDFVEQHAKVKTRQWQETSRRLGLTAEGEVIPDGLCDRWSARPIKSISDHDIHDVVDEARRSGIPGMGVKHDKPSEARARHLFSALSKMFSWLHRHRRIDVDPTVQVHRPEAGASRDRVLTDAEIKKFWKAAGGETVFGPVLKLLLLTGCRLNEVAGMRRSEIDGDKWEIPGDRTKNHRPHLVPLVEELVALIPAGEGDLIFSTNGHSPMSGWSKMKARLDEAMGIPPWRLHDLRRTTATGMANIGVLPHVVEACLNHVSGSKSGVAGVYNRAAYAKEKREALTLWAAHVGGLVG